MPKILSKLKIYSKEFYNIRIRIYINKIEEKNFIRQLLDQLWPIKKNNGELENNTEKKVCIA